MTRLHLVRHGPTHASGMVGWTDLPADLSDTAALARLSAYLPAQAVVVSSDLWRARATADAIQGQRTRLPHQIDLREINFGAWEMRHHADVEAETPDLIRAYWDQPGTPAPPGGESWNQISARANRAIDALIAAHPEQDLIVVVHFGVILTQLQRALAIPARKAFAHRIDNLSVTRISLGPKGWQTGAINLLP
ncbi:histidine phosphatase family protein [Pontibaca salina]|uniref:Histidine phosphatase family protein n=1 Tax=Pontibaca salina TaxID=2795731 RepID=A0A934M0H7_9RHOB|nr:histidine phosphatase family protein [Pontibaca salina]MBI6628676.1 histidine phosphatase family protein [Pontibaca salina]